MSSSASIYPLASDEAARAEAIAWSRFSNARERGEFCRSWLAILCAQVGRVKGGVVLLGPDADDTYAPVALWPDASRDLRHLSVAAERALGERRGIVAAADGKSPPTRDQPSHVAYPIDVSGVLHGAVVLEIGPTPDVTLQRALRLLHWSSAWLMDWFRQQALAERDARLAKLATTLELGATAMQERHLSSSALAVANEMARRLKCDRVSIGFAASSDVEIQAISNTAIFDKRMSFVRLIGDAMEEVLDLDASMIWPPREDDELGAVAHTELARDHNDVAICSVPMLDDGHPIGVVTLERMAGDPFDDATVELCQAVGGLIGPILNLKRENERGVLRRLREGFVDRMATLVGPRHPGVKLIALVIIGIAIFFSLATGTYRVAARTVVEGAVQRAAVAPFDGHISQSYVRAGDTVAAGEVLCRLDERDLKLERERLVSEREQSVRRQRQALAVQDRGAMMVASAQIAEADAQIALIDDRLARAAVKAPFAGIVVSGDLDQLLGTPVEQGKLLFQIAPLDVYRVILQVDERDIADVRVGQAGELTLSGLPDQRMKFAVQQITPIASQSEGRNFFRVEAHLQGAVGRVRPGMEGLGKIVAGERNLLWIWTHPLVEWFRFWTWKQLP